MKVSSTSRRGIIENSQRNVTIAVSVPVYLGTDAPLRTTREEEEDISFEAFGVEELKRLDVRREKLRQAYCSRRPEVRLLLGFEVELIEVEIDREGSLMKKEKFGKRRPRPFYVLVLRTWNFE